MDPRMSVKPLVVEIPPPDPESLLSSFPREGMVFLESRQFHPQQGRYSFLGVCPFQILECSNGSVLLNGERRQENPFDVLQQELSRFSFPRLPSLPPFQGGVAGFLGYELVKYLEAVPTSKPDDLKFPECVLGFYDLVIAWDHELTKAYVFSSGPQAAGRLEWALDCIRQAKPQGLVPSLGLSPESIVSTFTPSEYEKTIEQAIEYIRAGDIFEVNVSQRFSAMLPPEWDPLDVYRQLRHLNPAPFSAYLQYKHYAIASASPERFLRLHDQTVESRPIKGTRPRHVDPILDQQYITELQNSEKDRAENIMIVDLMRNDLSRVCLPHSVKVPQLCQLETFATVHHLVSAVEGKLMPGKTPVDLIKATFPGGSITGAPKIRAMEIIAELEPTVRGPYCGSIGYIGFNNEMDLSITIRTFSISNRHLTFQTGGAITVDSRPREEYDETLAKAAAMQHTLTQRE